MDSCILKLWCKIQWFHLEILYVKLLYVFRCCSKAEQIIVCNENESWKLQDSYAPSSSSQSFNKFVAYRQDWKWCLNLGFVGEKQAAICQRAWYNKLQFILNKEDSNLEHQESRRQEEHMDVMTTKPWIPK